MPVKRQASVKVTSTKKPVASSGVSAPVYSILGASMGKLALPKEIFGAKINQALLAQATRVYSSNQKAHFGNTKTRGEVHGTSAKVWRQKGTGRARHGARTAPIWVGGGIALGPKFRKVELNLSQKMRRKALITALSVKAKDDSIKIISNLDTVTGKTKQLASLIKKLSSTTSLIVGEGENAIRAVRNLPNTDMISPLKVDFLEVIKHQGLFISKEALKTLSQRLGGKDV